jgi:hypothetical protein
MCRQMDTYFWWRGQRAMMPIAVVQFGFEITYASVIAGRREDG